MASRTYATPSDYYAFTGTSGDDAVIAAALRRASLVVESLVRLSQYTVDDDGYPTDSDVSQAFTDATCAQAQFVRDTGSDTGADPKFQSMSLGSLSLSSTPKGTTARQSSSSGSSRYSPEAVQILRTAGLMQSAVAHG